MLNGRASIGPVVWPLQGVAQRLDKAIESQRFQPDDAHLRHWYKGMGTGMRMLKHDQFENFWTAAPLAQAVTVMKVSTAVSTQCAVWMVCGPMIGVAACVTRVTHGNQAACQFMADHYLPLHMWLQLTSLQLNVACTIGATMLFKRLLSLV